MIDKHTFVIEVSSRIVTVDKTQLAKAISGIYERVGRSAT